MEIVDIQIKLFSLKLISPIMVKGKNIKFREGAILYLKTKDMIGVGEVAPLAPVHQTSLSECIKELDHFKNSFQNQLLDIPSCDFQLPLFGLAPYLGHYSPLALFAIESALLTLLLQSKNHNFINFFTTSVTTAAKVNGLITGSNLEENLAHFARSGIRNIKIKIDNNFQKGISLIKKIAPLCDQLRLDANQQLNITSLRQYANSLAEYPIEYVEYIEEPSTEILWDKCPYPIALDESLNDVDLTTLNPLVKYLVIKPGVLPGLHSIFQLMDLTHLTIVLSSAYNSGVTLALFSLIQSALPHKVHHGLDTLKFFAEDLLNHQLSIQDGAITLPTNYWHSGPHLKLF